MTTLETTSHAVSRSSELLSCAKTALKIAQSSSQNENGTDSFLQQVSPLDLSLNNNDFIDNNNPTVALLEDGITLLRQMKHSLDTLSTLVKRRGHTNDPTQEISLALGQWEQDAKLLSEIKITPQVNNKQALKHFQLVQAWLQAVAAQQATELKQIMKLRSQVLQEQAQRRKLLNPNNKKSSASRASNNALSTTSSSSMARQAMDSPLFTVTNNTTMSAAVNGSSLNTNGHAAPHMARQSSLPPQQQGINGSTPMHTSSAPSSLYAAGGGYGGASNHTTTAASGYGGGGYGGGYGGTSFQSNTGMRQRKGGTTTTTTTTTDDLQVQIQQRQARRETQSRLENARQAESKLAELGTLFGKMSTLISQQGEVLEKVEDDVEAALDYVKDGEQEIQTLYSIKKGNRGLILKVFGILIFFIIFMRLY